VNFIWIIGVSSIPSHNWTLDLGNEEGWSLSRITILEINYHPSEANMVVNAWSRRTHLSQLEVEIIGSSSCASSLTSSTIKLL
jgi:hypothetical protein